MRSKNTLYNLISYFSYELILFVAGMIFPRFIIMVYGSEINGLSSTITRLLSLVNLIQAGAVGTAIYQMFAPVANNDHERQSEIIYAAKKYYKRIVVVYFLIAVLMGIIMGFRLQSETIRYLDVLFAFIIFSISGSVALYFNSIFDIFITSHQRAYYLKLTGIVNIIVNYGFLIITLYLKLPFIFIYIDVLLGSVANSLLNFWLFRRFSKDIIIPLPDNRNYKIPNRRYLMLSTIGTEIVSASPQIIISMIVGLAYTSVFSVYSMVFVSLKTVLTSVNYSLTGTLGNLVKTSDDNKIKEVYSCIQYIIMFMGIVLSACTAFLIMPFIKIYTNDFHDMNYYYPLLGLFTTYYICLVAIRNSFSSLTTVYGLFQQTCFVNIISGSIAIIISVVCVSFWGMPFAMIGLLSNQFLASIGTLVVLKRNIKWFRMSKLIQRIIIMILCVTLFTLSPRLIVLSIDSFIQWIVYGLICFGVVSCLLILISIIFESDELKTVMFYVKHIIRKK